MINLKSRAPKRLLSGLCAALLLALGARTSFAGIDWEGQGASIVSKILANPGAFFFEFQQDMEATNPLPPGKFSGINIGLFPTLLPLGYLNASGHYRLHAEGNLAPGIPQVELLGGYWSMAWAKVAADQSKDVSNASFNGYYYGLMATSSISPKVRLFWGYKHSQLKAQLDLDKTKNVMGVKVNSFSTGFSDDFFIAGIEHPISLNDRWTMQLNYGVSQKVVAAKVAWSGKYFDLGVNIYPEGVLVIHPVWNFHAAF